MQVIPFDIGTFWVESRSGNYPHLVDISYLEEGHRKPKPTCSCWRCQCHSEVCVHIRATLDYLKGVK